MNDSFEPRPQMNQKSGRNASCELTQGVSASLISYRTSYTS